MTQDFVGDPVLEAIRLHGAGALDEARAIYKGVLAREQREARTKERRPDLLSDDG